jgi:hypothetical protein
MEGMQAKIYSYMLYSVDGKGIIKHFCTSTECILHETVKYLVASSMACDKYMTDITTTALKNLPHHINGLSVRDA